MSPRSKDWHISGWRAVVLAPLLLPIAVLLSLVPFKKARDRSAAEVAGFLRDFIEGSGGKWDWDDFTSVPIADPRLEAIRIEANLISLPITEADSKKLRELLARVKVLEHAN